MIELKDIQQIRPFDDGCTGFWLRDGSWYCSCGTSGGPDKDYELRLLQRETNAVWSYDPARWA